MEPAPNVDLEREGRRLLEHLHVELAFADIARRALTEEAPAPGDDVVPEVPLRLLRAAAIVGGLLGLVLVALGFLLHPAAGLLGLFLLPVFVLLVVLAVEQTALRLRR